jgi:hypothetical protein
MIGWRSKPQATEEEKPKGFDDFELRLGDVMRGERATLGKSLLDVQRELKIKATYIAAIENADVSAFETPGFVAGYVRSYARYLGMEPDWAFQRFCKEANFTVAHGMSTAASPQRLAQARARAEFADPLANPNATFVPRGESVFSRIEPGAVGSVAVLVALIAAIGYGGWSVLREVQRVQLAPVDEAPVVVAQIDPLADAGAAPAAVVASEAAAETAEGKAAPDLMDRLYRPQALDVPVLVPRDGPIAAIDPRMPAAAGAAPQAGVVADAATGEALAGDTVQVLADARPGVEVLGGAPVLGAGQFGRWHGAVRKDPGRRRALCRAAAGNRGGVPHRQFRLGLFRGQRGDLWPGRAGRQCRQGRGPVGRGADREIRPGRPDRRRRPGPGDDGRCLGHGPGNPGRGRCRGPAGVTFT